MSKAVAFVVLLMLFLALAGWADAGEYANGYAADGYVYQNGYWYAGAQGYTRARWHQPGYYLNNGYGCSLCRVYVPGYYFYKYTPYYPPQTYQQPPLPSYNDPGWRAKLLDIAAAREKYEGEITRSAFEQQNYMEAVQALGLRAPRPNIPYYGAYGNGYAAGYGVNANTQYGYRQESFQANIQGYLDGDETVQFQQLNQLVQNAQRFGGEAFNAFAGTVAQRGQSREKVASIIARGQVLSNILRSLDGAPSAEYRGYSFRVDKGGKIERTEDPRQVTPEARDKLKEQFELVASAKCYDCHNDKVAKGGGKTFPGGFKIADYYQFNVEQLNRVWEVITTDDPKLRMPLARDGGPGVPLTVEEKRLFFLAGKGQQAAGQPGHQAMPPAER